MKPRRTNALRIRVSAGERLAIDRAAELIGVGPSTFARMATIKAAGLTPAPPPRRRPDNHAVALGRWTGELNRIGVNINELARAHNSGSSVDTVTLRALSTDVRALREAVLKFHSEQLPEEP